MPTLNISPDAATSDPLGEEMLHLLQDAAIKAGWQIEHEPTPNLPGCGGMSVMRVHADKMPERCAEFVDRMIDGLTEIVGSLSRREKPPTIYLTRIGSGVFEKIEARWRFE